MKNWNIAVIAACALIAGAIWAWSLYLQSLPDPAPVSSGDPAPEAEPAGPEIPDYPFDDEPIDPKFEEAIDLRGDDPVPIEDPAAVPGFSSDSQPDRPIYVKPQSRENCEGWVEIAFENDQDIVSGKLDILDSKPPGKYDEEAMELLLETMSLETYSPLNSSMVTTYFSDGRQKSVFTYFVGCD
jgi:hypothetical protein